MCDICHSFPCLSRCPNAPKPEHIYCKNCSKELYEGDDVIVDNNLGRAFCDCVCYAEYLSHIPSSVYQGELTNEIMKSL